MIPGKKWENSNMRLKFFKKPSFGLDISDYSIEIIFLRGNLRNPKLFAMGRAILEPGIVEDGKIINRQVLKKSLSAVIKSPQFGKITTADVIFALPESKTFLHIFDLPADLEKKKQIPYIESQASQTFPYPLEELSLDFKITKNGNDKRVLLAAVPQKTLNNYQEVFKDLGLNPLSIGMESESLGRSLIPEQKEPVLILDMGARTTNFSIFDEGNIRFSYTIEVAGNEISKSLSQNLKISFEEAEEIKQQSGLNPNPKEGRIFMIIQKEIQAIIWEIKKIEQYFSQKEEKTFNKIILAGGSALLPYLSQYLKVNIEKEVSIGDPWERINIDILRKKDYFPQALKINPLIYAPCIGSALKALTGNPQKEGINFLAKHFFHTLSFRL